MTPLDMMKALREVPDDLIDPCLEAPVQHPETPGLQPQNSGTVQVQAFAPVKSAVHVPRMLTGLAVAACAVFAVGVGAFLIRGHRDSIRIQSMAEQADTTAEPENAVSPERVPDGETSADTAPEAAASSEAAMPAVTTQPAKPVQPAAGSAELELHEQKKRVYSWEDADGLIESGAALYAQNGPVQIDTQDYITKYFSADSAADLNDPEAKSYIYHMMLNSVDYYSSAEGIQVNDFDGSPTVTMEFQTDDAADASYSIEYCDGMTHESYYSADLNRSVDRQDNSYTETICGKNRDYVISDNDRVVLLDDGENLSFHRPDPTWLGSSCLFPQAIAMSRLSDFGLWHITETAELLGRTCAVIDGTHSGRTIRLHVDVRTGILLKYEELYADGSLRDREELTALTVDEPVAVRQFDPTGLTRKETARPVSPEPDPALQ